MMSNKYDVKLTWNFSTTSHGKGHGDRVVATLKKHAMKKVITRKRVINNAEESYNAKIAIFRLQLWILAN